MYCDAISTCEYIYGIYGYYRSLSFLGKKWNFHSEENIKCICKKKTPKVQDKVVEEIVDFIIVNFYLFTTHKLLGLIPSLFLVHSLKANITELYNLA